MLSTTSMKTAKFGCIASSVLFCIFGALLMIFPKISISLIGTLAGCLMIAFGIFKVIGYFSKDLFRLAFQYDLAFGILLAVLGTIVLMRPGELVSLLCITLGIAILTDGLFKIQIAMDSKRFGIGKWWLILLSAILTGCLGLTLVLEPVQATEAVMILLGAALMFDGIMSLITVLSTVKIVNNQRPDVIEVRYKEV